MEINLESLEARIRAALIDGLWFDAQQVAISSLKFEKYDQELDHGWHEFHALFETAGGVTKGESRDIKEIVEVFEKLKIASLV